MTRAWLPSLMIHWHSFPFNTHHGWAESWELALRKWVCLLPTLSAFGLKQTFLSTNNCLSSTGYLFSFVYLGFVIGFCLVSLMESRYSFPFFLLPSVLSFCIVISQKVAFHKKENHRVKCRHRLYKAVIQAGLTDWWNSHQIGVSLDKFGFVVV